MEIERDATVHGFEITDYSGDESQVIYCEEGEGIIDNPLYGTGYGKRKFVVISVMDGGTRVNRLLVSDDLVSKLR